MKKSLLGERKRTDDIYYCEGIKEDEAWVHDHAKVNGKGGSVADRWQLGWCR